MKGWDVLMINNIKDAFSFLIDIFKGELPVHDLYLIALIMIIMPIGESIREARQKVYTKPIFLFCKWVPISFLVVSIYLTGFYYIANLVNEIVSSPNVFQDKQSLRSIAIMSLTMASTSALIISVGKLDKFFINNKIIFTFIVNSLLITIGMYFINLIWYETIKVPLWSYGLIGVINTVFICFLLWEQNKESRELIQEQQKIN
ncbi:hypothetical protein CN491_26405 [Bacillus cereus]|uniref:Uncharacterized protein n=2 Tax=Bacillus cereus TaxID=1396 RepID=A0A2A8LGU8_BACCE|nr:hypothetical protein CN491_26405 [Bacillus cereus]PFP74906.1 hypothetical protein COJ95_19740 [Bacillus cereus]